MRFRRLMRVIVLMFAAACSPATVYVPLTHWACSHPSGWGVWLTKCSRFSRLLHYSWGTGACVRQTFFTLALLIIHAAALTSTAGRPQRCWEVLSNLGLILGPSRSSIGMWTSAGRRTQKDDGVVVLICILCFYSIWFVIHISIAIWLSFRIHSEYVPLAIMAADISITFVNPDNPWYPRIIWEYTY